MIIIICTYIIYIEYTYTSRLLGIHEIGNPREHQYFGDFPMLLLVPLITEILQIH
jgi:hypothetical protein